MDRRQFLKAGCSAGSAVIVGAALTGCSGKRSVEQSLLSVAKNRQGHYSIEVFSAQRERTQSLTLPSRAHHGAVRPYGSEVVVFDRRPGRRFYLLNTLKLDGYRTIQSVEGRHFYGHGAFSHDGRWLYTTENHLETLKGVIGIYDAAQSYQRVGEYHLDGHGPHEIRMMPDGNTLVIALGGLKTHPDSGRKTLNPDTLNPALIYLDRHTGKELEKRIFLDTRLSIRHLDVCDDGLVAFGMQLQADVTEPLPLVATHRRGQAVQGVKAKEEQWLAFNGYIASVCCLPAVSTLVCTSPRGTRV